MGDDDSSDDEDDINSTCLSDVRQEHLSLVWMVRKPSVRRQWRTGESRERGRLRGSEGGWEPTFEEENAEEAHAEDRQEARITAMTTIETPILSLSLLKRRFMIRREEPPLPLT
jgi:hypothetical protein